MSAPLLVTGATGTVGTPLVRTLLRRGERVRAVARRPGPVDQPGLEPVAFDFTDPSTFPAAFTGVEVMFLVRPPALARPDHDLIPALTHAVAAGVRHVVFLSVQGVERLPVLPHARIERWLRASGLGWTFLRASFFDQNLITVHGATVRERGDLVMPAGSGRTAFVDAEDVAEVAAQALTDPDQHRGQAHTVTGSESLTYGEVAGIMTAMLGRPVRYTQPGLLRYVLRDGRRAGLPPAMVAMTSVVYTTTRLGLAAGLSGDAPDLLGRPPTTLAQFVARERTAFTPEE